MQSLRSEQPAHRYSAGPSASARAPRARSAVVDLPRTALPTRVFPSFHTLTPLMHKSPPNIHYTNCGLYDQRGLDTEFWASGSSGAPGFAGQALLRRYRRGSRIHPSRNPNRDCDQPNGLRRNDHRSHAASNFEPRCCIHGCSNCGVRELLCYSSIMRGQTVVSAAHRGVRMLSIRSSPCADRRITRQSKVPDLKSILKSFGIWLTVMPPFRLKRNSQRLRLMKCVFDGSNATYVCRS
jgi:hypothetical protein